MSILKRWTKGDDEFIIKNREKPIKFLSAALSRSIPSIKHRKKKLEITENNLWNEEDSNSLKEYYENKSKDFLLNIIPDKTWGAIVAKGKKLGLKRKDFDSATRRKGEAEKLLNGSFQSYYFIGLLFADGYFNKTTIRLSQSYKNREVVHNFAKYLGIQSFVKESEKVEKIKILNRDTVKNGICYVQFKNKIVLNELAKIFDIKLKKGETKTYNPPNVSVFNKMTDNEFISFLIGFIDGDGSIPDKKNKTISISANKNWERAILNWRKRLTPILRKKFTEKSVYIKNNDVYFRVYGDEEFMYFYKFIKDNNLVVMKRKWQIKK